MRFTVNFNIRNKDVFNRYINDYIDSEFFDLDSEKEQVSDFSELVDNILRTVTYCQNDITSHLISGKLSGVATDVYEHEVGIFHNNWEHKTINDKTLLALKSIPNVLLTPHYAFYTDEAVSNMVEFSLQNLYEFETTGECKNKC